VCRGGFLFSGHSLTQSGCPTSLLRSFFFLKVRSDTVQIIGENSESHVALVSALCFVRATIKPVLLKGVDVAFYRAVSIGEFTPFLISLTFAVCLAELPFLGHDDGGDF